MKRLAVFILCLSLFFFFASPLRAADPTTGTIALSNGQLTVTITHIGQDIIAAGQTAWHSNSALSPDCNFQVDDVGYTTDIGNSSQSNHYANFTQDNSYTFTDFNLNNPSVSSITIFVTLYDSTDETCDSGPLVVSTSIPISALSSTAYSF